MQNYNLKKILYVGENYTGSHSQLRFNALQRLGYNLDEVNFLKSFNKNSFKGLITRILHKFSYSIDFVSANDKIYKKISSEKYYILWIDKGLTIKPDLINEIKKSKRVKFVIGYYNDDMFKKHNQSIQWKQSLPLYDLILTTKSYNVNELLSIGAKRVEFVNNCYDIELHKPKKISQKDKKKFGGPVGFIGAWEKERLDSILFLAKAGIGVRWWGGGWSNKKFNPNIPNLLYENDPLWGDDYSNAINSFDINLCFLRKINRDVQTIRSIEIPACGGFMLAERTEEHQILFEEGKEAEFFSSDEELLDKTRFYLTNSNTRIKIAQAGRERCEKSGYNYESVLSKVISMLENS